MDSVEQKLNGQDQAHRTLMEQIMKLNQEMKVLLFENFLVSTKILNVVETRKLKHTTCNNVTCTYIDN